MSPAPAAIRPPTIVICMLAGFLLFSSGCGKKPDQGPAPPNQGDLISFVNSKNGLPQRLIDHYVDFSFQHPRSWKVVRANRNYVQAEQAITAEKLGDCTVENISVGGFWLTGSNARPENLATSLADAATKMSDGNAAQFLDYKRVSGGPVLVAGINGHEFRFAFRHGPPKDEIPFWGRTIILPHPSGEGDGLIMMMHVSSLSRAVTSADDVGVKGELPIILKSFRVGK